MLCDNVQIGITSFGSMNCSTASVFVNVSHYRKWIEGGYNVKPKFLTQNAHGIYSYDNEGSAVQAVLNYLLNFSIILIVMY